jgi:hypothetical protein
MADEKPAEEIDQGELDVAYRTIRETANESGAGKLISDADCRKWALKIVEAIEGYRKGDII